MKYSPKMYAYAFADTVLKAHEKEHEAMIKNFVALLHKNGDLGLITKILPLIETRVVRESSRRKVILEGARTLPLREHFKKFLMNSDIVEERVNPELVAGVRITVNDELQFDGSLKRKLQKLFTES